MTQLLPPKKEVALALLERSNVDVYLDPRAKGVVVPPQFRKEPRLILKIGLNMPVPIPDLRLDDESMSCTLSFNRAKFFCVVPWLSVFAMVGDDGRGMVWPDDVPQELAVRVVDDRRSSPGSADGRQAPAPASSRSGGAKGKSRIQPDSERDVSSSSSSSSSSSADRGGAGARGRGKSKKKKEEAARPVLVAVPPPEKSSPRVEKLDERRESREARESKESKEARERDGEARPAAERPAPATPRVSGAEARPPGATRPKRELPPYLRVVK
jgi:stringent starvation protein B